MLKSDIVKQKLTLAQSKEHAYITKDGERRKRWVKRPTCDKSASRINGFPIFAIQFSKSRIKADATITPRIPSWVLSTNVTHDRT